MNIEQPNTETTSGAASAGADERATTAYSSATEPPMTKPSMIWMIVPVLLIAFAIFLAR